MTAIPSGARVRLLAACRGCVVSPETGLLVTVPHTLSRGLEGIAIQPWVRRPLHTHMLVTFSTPGPWPAQLWISTAYLEEIVAEVVA